MTDLILSCANCGNQFVFSEGEQAFYHEKGVPDPIYCPICRSIKAQERRLPPKPVKDSKSKISEQKSE